MDRVLNMFEDENVNDLYKVDIIYAMQAWKGMWHKMISKIFANYWHYTGLIESEFLRVLNSILQDEFDFQTFMHNLVPCRARICVSNVLKSQDESGCIASVFDAPLFRNCISF